MFCFLAIFSPLDPQGLWDLSWKEATKINSSYTVLWGFPGGSLVQNLPANTGNVGSIPGSGRSPREWDGNPLQYSCLENPMDGGAWWATVLGVAKWVNYSRYSSLAPSWSSHMQIGEHPGSHRYDEKKGSSMIAWLPSFSSSILKSILLPYSEINVTIYWISKMLSF